MAALGLSGLDARVDDEVAELVEPGGHTTAFDGTRPTGLIDWEIWTYTHPGIDLGWFLVFCVADLFPGIGEPVAGLPNSAELVDRYRAADVEVEDLAWFEAFCGFTMGAIMAHNLRRHREGRHIDPFQERLPPTIEALVRTGIAKLDR